MNLTLMLCVINLLICRYIQCQQNSIPEGITDELASGTTPKIEQPGTTENGESLTSIAYSAETFTEDQTFVSFLNESASKIKELAKIKPWMSNPTTTSTSYLPVDMLVKNKTIQEGITNTTVPLTVDETRETTNLPDQTTVQDADQYSEILLEKLVYLTAYIEAGDFIKARQQARVDLDGFEEESYAGFITINTDANSNMFFWFFPTSKKSASAQLLINLGGGSSLSSVEAVLGESGPYVVTEELKVLRREIHWTSMYHVLYLDPVLGAGFSFTDSEDDYPVDSTEVAKHIHKCLLQFFALFHEYRNVDLYIVGNSYAGKFAEALAYYIHYANDFSPMNSKLRGVALLSGLMEPLLDMTAANYLYQVGLVNQRQAVVLKQLTEITVEFVKSGSYHEAAYVVQKQLQEYQNMTGMSSDTDILSGETPKVFELAISLVDQSKAFRNAVHVGNRTFFVGDESKGLYRLLEKDQFKSYSSMLEFLLDHGYKILVVGGQFDAKYSPAVTDQALVNLNWTWAKNYLYADRDIFYQNGTKVIAGYVTTLRNLYYVNLREAAHFVVCDQPEATFDAINNFVQNLF